MKPIAQQQTIWITGATSGIGEALAHELARQGHTVIATGRNTEALQLLNHYDGIHTCTLDITDDDALRAFSQHVEAQWGSIDTVVVNAGNCRYLRELPAAAHVWEANYAPNLLGAMKTINTALPLLDKSPNRGQIVGVLSLVIFAPFSQAEFYGATKAALDYYLKSLRIDLAAKSIDVTAIYPGFVKTPLTDRNPFSMPFIVSAQTAAERMAKAMKARKRSYVFPKRLYCTLKFFQLLPGLWDRIYARKSRVTLTRSDT